MATTLDNRERSLGGIFRYLLARIGGSNTLEFGLAVFAIVSGIGTYLTLTGAGPFAPTTGVIITLMVVNLAVVLTMLSLIAWRLVRLWRARRSGSAGSRLHLRMVSLFSAVAVMPAIIVAVFAAVTLNEGLDAWFSERSRTIINNAVSVAEAYLKEHSQVIRGDALAMANDLNRAKPLYDQTPERFTDLVTTQAALRALPSAYVINSSGEVLVRARASQPVDFTNIPDELIRLINERDVVIMTADDNNQVRALVRLQAFDDAFLFVARYVDSGVLELLGQTREARLEYEQLEGRRTGVQITFALIYTVVALLVLLAAIWVGLAAANSLVSPIGSLVGAAERVSEGDLSARVDVGPGDDEIGMLGRAFNRMTGQLESQRNELIEANRQLDRRRRFTEAVLSGVTAGVIGLDATGRIAAVNRSCLNMLGMPREELIGQRVGEAVPELAPLVSSALAHPETLTQGQITIDRDGNERSLTVRVTSEISSDDTRGYIVTIDDITELVTAQRASAWADIARRIAHEIKNPLTPIQLSAERLRRKYGKEIQSDPHVFEQCTDTIIRQVSDIGRMVDEFSAFARMPTAVMAPNDLTDIVRQAVFLQRVAHPDIVFRMELPAEPLTAECDSRLISQAMINILKNAAEAIAARAADGEGEAAGTDHAAHTAKDQISGHITVSMTEEAGNARVSVVDDGVGLPKTDRHKLFEPYMTTRPKGTGLGLAIVNKVLEDHHGELTLEDAPPDEAGHSGAAATITLPLRQKAPAEGPAETSAEAPAKSEDGDAGAGGADEQNDVNGQENTGNADEPVSKAEFSGEVVNGN